MSYSRPIRRSASRLITCASLSSRRPSMSNTMILRRLRQPHPHLQHLVELLVGPRRTRTSCWSPWQRNSNMHRRIGRIDPVRGHRPRRGCRSRHRAIRDWYWRAPRRIRRARSRAPRAPLPISRAAWPNARQVMLCQRPSCFWRRITSSRRVATPCQNMRGTVSAAAIAAQPLRLPSPPQLLLFHRRVPLTPPAFMPR